MSKVNQINKLKEMLAEEQMKQVPNKGVISKLKQQILNLGIGLTPWDFNKH